MKLIWLGFPFSTTEIGWFFFNVFKASYFRNNNKTEKKKTPRNKYTKKEKGEKAEREESGEGGKSVCECECVWVCVGVYLTSNYVNLQTMQRQKEEYNETPFTHYSASKILTYKKIYILTYGLICFMCAPTYFFSPSSGLYWCKSQIYHLTTNMSVACDI